MTLQHWLSTPLLVFAFSAYADTCPKLEGTFLCRANPPFEIQVQEQAQDDLITYTLVDPKSAYSIIPDQQFHQMDFPGGKGQYRAYCQYNRLFIEVQPPTGAEFVDQYYIERAALVRVRRSRQQASSLSCGPTRGTWRNYQR